MPARPNDLISFLVTRRHPRGRIKYTWLSGGSNPSEARAEAQDLCDDPRDTIINVSLWSDRDEQFVGVVRQEVGDAVN